MSVLHALSRKQASALPAALLLSPFGIAVINAALTAPVEVGAVAASVARIAGTVLAVGCLLGFLFILLGLPLLLLASWRKHQSYLPWLSAIPVACLGWGLAVPVRHLRESWLRHAANRGELLVQALERYRATRGAYPRELAELVPRELPALPGTGMLAYPEFEYQREPSPVVGSAPYELRVAMPFGPSYDVLVRRPSSIYPRRLYGGTPTQIDGWAYVRE